MIQKILRSTHKYVIPVLKSGWLPILAGAFLLEIPVQGFRMYQKSVEIMIGPTGMGETLRIMNEVFILLFEALISAYIMFCVSVKTDGLFKNKKADLIDVTKETAIPLTVESLRALGKTILGLVLFIIPGLYFYVRYSQVPYVVMFSDAYKSGKADALKLSNFLTVGKGFMVSMFLVGTGIISLYISVFKSSYPPIESPLIFGVCFLVNFLVQVYISVASYFLYDLLMEDKKGSI